MVLIAVRFCGETRQKQSLAPEPAVVAAAAAAATASQPSAAASQRRCATGKQHRGGVLVLVCVFVVFHCHLNQS